ncbi:MAG TPA: hypothetical protein VIO11_07540 [Candidatus Methanoperedens sp.]
MISGLSQNAPVDGLSEMVLVICDKQPNVKRKFPEWVARTRRKPHAKAWGSSHTTIDFTIRYLKNKDQSYFREGKT